MNKESMGGNHRVVISKVHLKRYFNSKTSDMRGKSYSSALSDYNF